MFLIFNKSLVKRHSVAVLALFWMVLYFNVSLYHYMLCHEVLEKCFRENICVGEGKWGGCVHDMPSGKCGFAFAHL